MEAHSQRIGAGLATIPIVAGILILIGWQFRIPVLRGEAFGTFVAPTTALCFLLCGVSVLLQVFGRKWLADTGASLGAVVALFSLITVAEYIFNTDLGIDRLFFAHRLDGWNLPLPGRFSINAAIAFSCCGLSLATARLKSISARIPENAAIVVLLVSYLSVMGYLYSTPLLYGGVMAIHTAIILGFLGFSVLFFIAGPLATEILLSPHPGGIISRRIISAILLLMPLFGVFWVWMSRFRLVSMEFGSALFVLLAVLVFTVLTLRTATVVNDLDKKRRDTETALIRSEKLAAAGRMAASVAHEINNPLEAVGNLLFLMRSDALPGDTRRQYLQIAEEELNRVAAIARRTLGFYRETSKPVELDVREVIESTLEVYRTRITRKGIEVKKEYCDGAFLLAPEGEIRQVIANLVSNAIDALAEEGSLDIAIRAQDKLLVISIGDNGHGIQSGDLARIFEPFFSTKSEVGTGLGLWITKELIAKNNGRIAVESSTDSNRHGTIFTLTFPLSERGGSSRRLQLVEARG